MPFSAFDLPPDVKRGLDEAGFTLATPIQARALPIALAGRDVAGQAKTGTGKTAAYLTALFTHLLRLPAAHGQPQQPRAFILAPTRELALQIHRDATSLGRHTPFTLGLVYGGVDYLKQRQQLEAGVDILIGTPGRVIDYFKQHVFDLRAVQVLVLDEADRMFDLGFIKDIRYLLRRLPRPDKRLSLLFSATLSYRVMELAYEHMNNPELIKIDHDITVENVRERAYFPANAEKVPLLLGLLRHEKPERAIVFVNTKPMADRLAAYLLGNGLETAVLSGDVPQRKRQRLLQDFATGQYPLLVATDVASRGLHIPEVSHVINFDLPQTEADYVHRIGRTARAGAKGDAISFACEDYALCLPAIETFIGHKLNVEPITPDLLVTPKPPARDPQARGRPHPGSSARQPRPRKPGPSRRRPHRTAQPSE